MEDTQAKPKTKEYIRTMSPTWWLQKPAYTRFMIRDVTSVFIGAYCVFLLVLMLRAAQGPEAFGAFVASLRSPVSIVLHLIALVFAAYHSVTFFNLTPRVIVVYKGDDKLPESLIAGAHYVAWAVVSIILLVIVLMW